MRAALRAWWEHNIVGNDPYPPETTFGYLDTINR